MVKIESKTKVAIELELVYMNEGQTVRPTRLWGSHHRNRRTELMASRTKPHKFN